MFRLAGVIPKPTQLPTGAGHLLLCNFTGYRAVLPGDGGLHFWRVARPTVSARRQRVAPANPAALHRQMKNRHREAAGFAARFHRVAVASRLTPSMKRWRHSTSQSQSFTGASGSSATGDDEA